MFAVIYMYMYAVMNKILGTSKSEDSENVACKSEFACVCVCVFFFIFITIILFQLTCTLSNVAHNSPGIEFLKTISKFTETKFCHDF